MPTAATAPTAASRGKPGGNTINPSSPAGDSVIMGGGGAGKVDEKKLRQYAENVGQPAAGQAGAGRVQEITRDLPPKYKPMIEDYFKSLNRVNGFQNAP